MIRVKIGSKWRRIPVIYGKTGRVIPGLVNWAGRELKFEDVAYEARYYKGGKAIYEPVGRNATDAEEKRRTLQAQLSAKAIAKQAGVVVVEDPVRKTIAAAYDAYIDTQSVRIDDSQMGKIKYASSIFLRYNSKVYVDELTETDMTGFLRVLQNYPVYWLARKSPSKRVQASQIRRRLPVQHRKISNRTIFHYFWIVRAWLLKAGAEKEIFPTPPKYEKKEITIYTPEEIEVLYSFARGNLRMAISLMLKCGMRRQEAAHACFGDIDYAEKTILIQEKPEYGFQTKTRKQRRVPVPDDLLEELRQWEKEHPRQALIVQTAK